MLFGLAQNATNITFGGWGGVAEDEGVKAAIEAFHAEQTDITCRVATYPRCW